MFSGLRDLVARAFDQAADPVHNERPDRFLHTTALFGGFGRRISQPDHPLSRRPPLAVSVGTVSRRPVIQTVVLPLDIRGYRASSVRRGNAHPGPIEGRQKD
jgi:hypothetical protein